MSKIQYAFKGFPLKNGDGKTRHYDGLALLESVGPDWQGPETFVVSKYSAVAGSKAILGAHHEEYLRAWIAKDPKVAAEIERLLKQAATAEK